MIRRALPLCSLSIPLFFLAACEITPPPVAPLPPPPAPTVELPPPPVEAPKAEPTAEEKKKAADAAQLAEDRAKWEEDSRVELARWTPELHKEAKALAEKTFPTAKGAIQAALAGKHRKAGSAERDAYRHPEATLAFFGFQPKMTVLDIGPGDGWYTEILAPALASRGKYIATNNDPNGPADVRGTFYGQRFKALLDKAPELYGKTQTIVIDPKGPKLNLEGAVDMVLIMRGVHGMKNNGTLGGWLAEVHRALKPNGVLGIEEHRAAEGANPDESAKKGYLPEKWVIDQVVAAGFKLSGKSEINANPKDTKDYPDGVWDLPPTFRAKEKDHDRYAATGESDRMTLKFVKVAAAKAAPKK